jgi:hypothetical protein
LLEGADEVLGGRLQDRLHELLGGYGAVLQHLDRAEVARCGIECCDEGLRITGIRLVALRGDAFGAEVVGKRIDVCLGARDQSDREPFASEAPGRGNAEPGAGADDRDGGHGSSCVGLFCICGVRVRHDGSAAPVLFSRATRSSSWNVGSRVAGCGCRVAMWCQ